jgi:3-deoxy-7-phosphoheptulonate synthase
LRGIRNPIGIKVGPTTSPEDLQNLVLRLNPSKEPGKITLITRYGADQVKHYLPLHIAALKEIHYESNVVWCCDPMHGNTTETQVNDASGRSICLKTRLYQSIISELQRTLDEHLAQGTFLGGVHLELTGDPVTECLGGSMELQANELQNNYQTQCDPRLNAMQALDVAFLVAKYHQEQDADSREDSSCDASRA